MLFHIITGTLVAEVGIEPTIREFMRLISLPRLVSAFEILSSLNTYSGIGLITLLNTV